MGARDGSSTSQGGVAVAVGQGETVPESTAVNGTENMGHWGGVIVANLY